MEMIKVEDKTHEEAKRLAKEAGMTLMGFIRMLVREYNEKWGYRSGK